MTNDQYVLVDLTATEKKLIMELASFFIMDEATKADLMNARKKWIRFGSTTISDVVGELSYYFNRSNDPYKSGLLDQLIDHLEAYETHRTTLRRLP